MILLPSLDLQACQFLISFPSWPLLVEFSPLLAEASGSSHGALTWEEAGRMSSSSLGPVVQI